ncbi:DUF4331 domain-containing protein [Herbidospora sp. NEAU-GS84]|uniref:DUF4331 domain-containing protein n=1 Tax=Herbidospora solisilvae TaxID=2696284 RepID=A0A7C9J541_9ACTN|nr:DUF4331 family protein [Herbidospora solisilvae]NAS24967.1 DUF4331 domain-containing protein [Herbidospora solisilvae]
MSHHLDSPLARQDPRLDVCDLYVFRGERGTVLAADHSHSFAGPEAPKGFHPEGRYEFKIDGDGDAVEDVTFRFTFGERDDEGGQTFRLHRVTSGDEKLIAEGRLGETTELDGGGRVWTGQAGDSFWIEPDVLHAVGQAFQHGTTVDLTGWNPDKAGNLFAGHTVYSIVLELPDDELLAIAGPDGRIGVWAQTSLATDSGGWRPINRCGLPMIHPLFTQYDEDLGDRLNTNDPADDIRVHGDLIRSKVAGVVRAYGTAADPEAYAQTVMERMLPNMLPYRVGTKAAFTFAGWNGRTLTDNAPDVMFSFAANTPVTLGIGRESVTPKPRGEFPYVPTVEHD